VQKGPISLSKRALEVSAKEPYKSLLNLCNCSASLCRHIPGPSAREASWRRAFDPCTPLRVDLYHFLEQHWYFGLEPENPILSEPGLILVDGFDTRHIPRRFSCGLIFPIIFQNSLLNLCNRIPSLCRHIPGPS